MMTINEYFNLLEKFLNSYENKPYERQNEGLVYIGINDSYEFNNLDEKKEFVYYLCLFVTIDLKIFHSYNENYLVVKNCLKTPKFEYGLTNTFIYPDRIFSRFNIRFDEKLFNECYKQYEYFLLEKFNEFKININLNELNKKIFNDSNLKCGIWGKKYFNYMKSK